MYDLFPEEAKSGFFSSVVPSPPSALYCSHSLLRLSLPIDLINSMSSLRHLSNTTDLTFYCVLVDEWWVKQNIKFP